MKVLFLIQGHEVAASRYRVLQYIPYLKSYGVETMVSLYQRSIKEDIQFFSGPPPRCYSFFQRKKLNQLRLRWLRTRAKQ